MLPQDYHHSADQIALWNFYNSGWMLLIILQSQAEKSINKREIQEGGGCLDM